jgi:hypothetical protein
VVESWRTPDGRWLVDRVIDEPGTGYRISSEGTPVGDLPADPAALSAWLPTRRVEVAEPHWVGSPRWPKATWGARRYLAATL